MYVGAGDYDEALVMIDTLALIGMGWDSTYIHADSFRTPAVTCHQNGLVRDIHFSHDYNYQCLYSDVFNSAGITVLNCKFTDSGTGVHSSLGLTRIEGCIFSNCSDGVGNYWGTGDLYINNCLFANITSAAIITDTRNLVVTDCIFRDFPNATSYGIFQGASISNNITHNLFCNIAGYGCWGCGDEFYFTNNVFYNFHVWDNYATAMEQISSGIDISNNAFVKCDIAFEPVGSIADTVEMHYINLWQNQVDFSVGSFPRLDTVGLVRADPMFYDAENHDFHLQAFSPLIDAGNPEILDEDGSRSDIGVFGGPGGMSYEYLDLPPRIPDSLWGYFSNDSVFIGWRMNYETDFEEYEIYRDTVPNFEPSIFNLMAVYDSCNFFEPRMGPAFAHYYKIAAVDYQGNRSDYSEELGVFLTGIFDEDGLVIPSETAIVNNYPNPFNSQTMLVYAVANLGPIPAQINIEIFDITGRRVRELVNERKGVGNHNVIWDGRDDAGNEVSTGIYFARISQWGISFLNKPLKLTLLR